MSGGTLIVGASQAGVQLAVSLREAGDDEPIVLVGAETHPPYQRPPLSKAFLAGHAEASSLELRTPAFYADRRITVHLGERVTELRPPTPDRSGSGTATTDGGRTLSFDRLALTVGARPRRLDVPGTDLDGVCYLRVIDDAVRLRSQLARASQVVIIGGGFIGLETAAAARAQGGTVTVVEAAERLVSRSVAPVVSEFYRHAHARRGTQIRLDTGVTAIHGDGAHGAGGRVRAVELADGTFLPADLVVVGIGVVPRTELAEQLGLACAEGIVVDEFARTSQPSVVAAGDCTVLPDPLTGQGLVRLESMPNAVGQARVAAATLAGKPSRYSDVPWFWSDQYDLKLQIAGLADGFDELVVRGSLNDEKFSVLYYRRGQLRAITSVNSASDYLAVRRALSVGASIPADRAADPTVALKDLLGGGVTSR